jgi:hypothetical protein
MKFRSKYDKDGRPIKDGGLLNLNRTKKEGDSKINVKLYTVLSIVSFLLGIVGIAIAIYILYKIGNRDDLTRSEKNIKTICYISITFNFVSLVISLLTTSYYIW